MARIPPASPAPIRRSIEVSWDLETAFRRFTADFGVWWPSYAQSIGGRLVTRVVFECCVDGLIFEEHKDGTRFQWGRITAFEPPRRVAFRFYASRDEHDAQDVEVTFVREGDATRVALVSTGWERMGDAARGAYGGYKVGWGITLSAYAGRFSGPLQLFRLLSLAIDLTRQRGSFLRGSRGRVPPTSTSERDE